MSTPNEITSLIAQISPNNIEQFCRLKFPANEFEPCRPGAGGHFRLDYSDALTDKNSAFVLRQFLDLTVDDTVQVIGRFMDKTLKIPILVYSVCLKGSISSRSSRKKQAEFAMFLLRQAKIDLGKYKGAWSQHYSTALFFFHDEIGNFRMSLIESLETRFRRFTFFVEHDTTGTKNRTFRYRMTNATANDKAARGDVEKWTGYDNIKAAFSVETLAKEFYNELFKWYERAVDSPTVIFPCDAAHKKPEETEEQFKVRIKSEQIIRLITRLLFVWFIKQKNLVPATLFDKTKLTKILQVFDDKNGDNYYRAILQNLFFATLNSEIKDRAFAADGTQVENSEHFDIKTLYRYRHEFAIPEKDVLALFCTIPFLNGGLFECLDRGAKYFDGFSRNLQQVAHVSNAFFFDEDDKTLGLIPLLNRYNFTVDENAPGDEDVALDPELLGKVFENLLASYNPETSTTARNATGSFYTPREIVSYMVDESLIAYLLTKMQDSAIEDDETQREENETILRRLFSDGVRSDDEALCQRLDQTLITAKFLTLPVGLALSRWACSCAWWNCYAFCGKFPQTTRSTISNSN